MQPDIVQRVASLEPEPSLGPCVSISARIASHAAAVPGQIAVVCGTTRLTFAELEHQSNQLATHLREMGAGPEHCVGIFQERSTDFVVSALAVLKSGAAYLPLDPSTPAERAEFILVDSGALALLTHRHKARDLTPGTWRIVDLDAPDAARIAALPATPVSVELLPENLAYVVYTSGSTGRPKGVEITHANLHNLIEWHQVAFCVTAADRASQVAGLGFDAVAWEIWPHLTAGASVHFADESTRRSPEMLRDWLVAERITISFVPTVLAEQMLHASWPTGTALQTMLTGADTLHRRPPAGLPFVLVNNYGPTECTVVATSGTVAPDSGEGQPSIGRPIANTSALILDDALHPVPAGEAGELCFAGALVGRGYRNNPELTASRFVTYVPPSGSPVRIYRTGDRACLLPSGEIAFLGRLDDQVKIRGYRIELGEVVACLDRHPSVEASAVVVRDSGDDLPTLVAYVVGARDALPSATDLREFLAARLPDYMIPAQFVAIATLPMTANGKLDKLALPVPGGNNLLPGVEQADACTTDSGLEERVGAMVASLLGQPSVEHGANFFLIGGHSMLGVQLLAKIRDTFGVKLTLRQLFSAPTVTALSAEVTRLVAAAAR